MNDSRSGYVSNRVVKLQVGFLLSEGVGQSRETEFDVPNLRIADDLMLDYLRGILRLSRTSRGILVQGTLQVAMQDECGRCLDKAPVQLEVPVEELFVYPPSPEADYSLADDGILDLAPLLREEIIIDTPIGVLCRPNCAGLCPTCGKNLNEGPCDCDRDEVDPRLAVLKALKGEISKD